MGSEVISVEKMAGHIVGVQSVVPFMVRVAKQEGRVLRTPQDFGDYFIEWCDRFGIVGWSDSGPVGLPSVKSAGKGG